MNNQQRLFLGCFIALVATAFGFAVRSAILDDWGTQFRLSEEEKGALVGVGMYPFAISIILFSLIVDRIGYGRVMVFAFFGHVISAILTIVADSFMALYWSTFLFALANGAVETVINPVVATVYDKNKTHWLNVLHAGWPGGLVLGGLLAIGVLYSGDALQSMGGKVWQWQMALVLLPTVVYGVLLFGQKFPMQERVSAGVSFIDMLREFGWGSSYFCFFLLIAGINQILVVAGVPATQPATQALIAIAPTAVFAIYIKSFGRPMFVFLLLVMFLLATTELGTDGWIADIMRSVLKSPVQGTLFLVWTSAIMFVLRFFAGPIVHRLSPLGLLALSAAVAAVGLTWLANAGSAVGTLFIAATLYGFGKTFFWPTTLGVVSEQYPKGGALMLNAIAGVGMLSVGVLGGPAIGTLQDRAFVDEIKEKDPSLHDRIVTEKPGIFGVNPALDQSKKPSLTAAESETVDAIVVQSKQGTLAKIAILPAIMVVCYLILIVYFKSKGGYQAQVLTGHAAEDKRFTGGLKAPIE
jgi:MFS family permease